MSHTPAKRRLAFALTLGLAWLSACAGTPPEAPAPADITIDPRVAARLERRVEGFYLRLAHRRFNTVETYNDRIMREHFRDVNLFLDYYADLAQALADANFEKRRPRGVEIVRLAFEAEDLALVRVRFLGDDRRPLRPGRVELLREDRWVREDGSWWIQPGKL